MGNCSSQGAKLSVQKFFKAVILTSGDATTGEELGAGNLEVTKYELVLHRRGMQTQRWPYIFLTRCDYKGSLFRIECKNPHLPDSQMEHVFRVKHANLLLQRIQAQVVENSLSTKSATVSDSKHSLVNSESDQSASKENLGPDGVIYPSRMKRIEAELEGSEGQPHFSTHSTPPLTLQQMQLHHLQQQRLQQQLNQQVHYTNPQQQQPHYIKPQQQAHYTNPQHLHAAPPLFYQHQMNQLCDFINSRNTLQPIYSDIYHHPPPPSSALPPPSLSALPPPSLSSLPPLSLSAAAPFLTQAAGDCHYASTDERHLANNNFSKALRNHDLKRKLCLKAPPEVDEQHSRLSRKRLSVCKRKAKRRPHHSQNSDCDNPPHHSDNQPHHSDNFSRHNDSDDMSIYLQRGNSDLSKHSMHRSLDMLDVGRGHHLGMKRPIHYL